MGSASLDTLPDDVIFDVIGHLDSARDLASLGASWPHIHSLIRQDGWRRFVRRGFPSLTVPSNEETDWGSVANRLTYLDRCWEKRGFLVRDHREVQQRKRRGQPSGGQSVSFYPVLDAHLLSSQRDELVVWGVGENLVTSLSPMYDGGQKEWRRLEGHRGGYSGGFGDVTAVSVVERKPFPEILVGRANGDLHLIGASGEEFGKLSQPLQPIEESAHHSTTSSRRKSPGQVAISWTEWQPEANIMATCRHTSLSLYDLNQIEEQVLQPVAHYDSSEDSAVDEISLVRSAKFLNRDTIACALGGSRHPLRWGKIRPTGLEFFDAAENHDVLDYVESKSATIREEKTTVRAIETVGRRTSESLVLSAWDDGTYRLKDVRTPSAFDAVYRDRWQSYEAGSSLLVYGTQRFVAGSNMAAGVRLFDFRYPKSYHHTDALPCSPELPHPMPPFNRGETLLLGEHPRACDPPRGVSCVWHDRSAQDCWRPDAALHLGNHRYDRVHALAKASDLSESFYCGHHGAVTEINLKLAEDVAAQDMKASAPPGWRARDPPGKVALVETGISLCRPGEWEMEDQGYPGMQNQKRQRPTTTTVRRPSNRYRLDSAYDAPQGRERDWG